MTDSMHRKGTGRRPLPVDPRIVNALEKSYRDGTECEIPVHAEDMTGDITALVREIRRAGRNHFPDLSTRVKPPKKKGGFLRFFLREKNPNLARKQDDNG